ncbi:MAG: ABC transporter ATP-binding protein [Clostridiales bacterium]|nr:ABC transporter ATP-binding protein [Clostridiales bacterium]
MSLIIESLVFSYENTGNKIINDFSAEFSGDRITALTGRNGVGKTTLSRLIMGILEPQSGEIILDGENMKDKTLAERGRLIGYVMQNPARQIFSSSVEEEIDYGLKNLGLSQEEREKRTTQYLEYFGMESYRKSFPFLLSHGEKQRLVLAAILAMKPKYLILDEPTASLDLKRRAFLGEHLKGLDCGVIIISHDAEFIRTYCDEVVAMEKVYE